MDVFKNLNRFIDNTILKPDSSMEDIESFIVQSVEESFRTVVVPNWAVSKAVKITGGSQTGLSVVVGFPLGYHPTEIKLKEIDYYLNMGEAVTDFDVVMNISAVKSGMYDYFTEELLKISDLIGDRVLKLIIETSLLSDDEIKKVCEICLDVEGLDFVKTGTGFASSTEVRDVEIISSLLKGRKKIKVSGGVRTLKDIDIFKKAGGDIFGASAGIPIMEEYRDFCQQL